MASDIVFIGAFIAAITPAIIAASKRFTKWGTKPAQRWHLWLIALFGLLLAACGAYLLRPH
ncbi:MAG: hypothetical protein WB919_08400 [Candidatus Sulfotelmatobacter sp.]